MAQRPLDYSDDDDRLDAARRERRRFSIVQWVLAIAGIALMVAAIALDARGF
ncbi:hypothetical protein ACDP63_16865 [Paracoccus sp. P2]|uniref:hypothetical protein n=1 Tax=Paracoccus sp. P2 TaxID=3248840 RepID=UPI00391F50B3